MPWAVAAQSALSRGLSFRFRATPARADGTNGAMPPVDSTVPPAVLSILGQVIEASRTELLDAVKDEGAAELLLGPLAPENVPSGLPPGWAEALTASHPAEPVARLWAPGGKELAKLGKRFARNVARIGLLETERGRRLLYFFVGGVDGEPTLFVYDAHAPGSAPADAPPLGARLEKLLAVHAGFHLHHSRAGLLPPSEWRVISRDDLLAGAHVPKKLKHPIPDELYAVGTMLGPEGWIGFDPSAAPPTPLAVGNDGTVSVTPLKDLVMELEKGTKDLDELWDGVAPPMTLPVPAEFRPPTPGDKDLSDAPLGRLHVAHIDREHYGQLWLAFLKTGPDTWRVGSGKDRSIAMIGLQIAAKEVIHHYVDGYLRQSPLLHEVTDVSLPG